MNKNDYLFQNIYNIKKTFWYGVHETWVCVGDSPKLSTYTNFVSRKRRLVRSGLRLLRYTGSDVYETMQRLLPKKESEKKWYSLGIQYLILFNVSHWLYLTVLFPIDGCTRVAQKWGWLRSTSKYYVRWRPTARFADNRGIYSARIDLSAAGWRIPFNRFADNNVWPPPCDIMPRDVFDGRRKVPNHPNGEK